MKSINVMHVIEELGVGGAERVVANYIKYHDTSCYIPQVCTLKGGGPFADEIISSNYKVTMLNKKPGLHFRIIRDLKNLIKKENIRVLHLHNPPANNWGIPASFLNRGIISIRTEHNIFYKDRVMKGYPFVNALLGLFNSRIICVSNQVKRTHLQKDWLNRKKYITIYNGIEGEAYKKDYDLKSLRREFGINDGQPIVGKIASLSKQKAHTNYFECVKMVLKKIPDAVFLVVGDGNLRDELKSRCEQMGLNKKIVFTGNRKDIPAILNMLDVFVLSSDWEGFPMTILEAMAAARPCVVTDVGGNREAVIESLTGFLVPPKNPSALAERIIEVLLDPNLSHYMGQAGRERFEAEFTVRKMVAETEQIYNQCLGV